MEHGYVQVYTGDGKGKTTAALGLALRASGHGLKVFIGQFMKGQDYSELRSAPRLEGVELEQFGDPGWVFKGKLKAEQIAQAEAGMARAEEVLRGGAYDLVILDELNMVVWFELVPLERVLALIEMKPAGTELVITGRRAAEEIIARADLVTEMREVKHYYTQKVPARRGIEN
jgi:cob(I)alamin adenosyltransferase